MKKLLLFFSLCFACLAIAVMPATKTQAETTEKRELLTIGYDTCTIVSYLVNTETGMLTGETVEEAGWYMAEEIALDAKYTKISYSCPAFRFADGRASAGFVFLDADKNLIISATGFLAEVHEGDGANGEIEIPAGAKYLRAAFCNKFGVNAPSEIYGIWNEEVETPSTEPSADPSVPEVQHEFANQNWKSKMGSSASILGTVRSWVVSKDKITGVYLLIDGTTKIDAEYGEVRDDAIATVPDFADGPNGNAIGFNATVDVSGLTPGYHKVELFATFEDETKQMFDSCTLLSDAADENVVNINPVVATTKADAKLYSNLKDKKGAFVALGFKAAFPVVIDGYRTDTSSLTYVGHYLSDCGPVTVYLPDGSFEFDTTAQILMLENIVNDFYFNTDNVLEGVAKPTVAFSVAKDITKFTLPVSGTWSTVATADNGGKSGIKEGDTIEYAIVKAVSDKGTLTDVYTPSVKLSNKKASYSLADSTLALGNVTVTAGANGKVSGAPSDKYPVGITLTVEAKGNENYELTAWSDGETVASREITVGEEDITLTANFGLMFQFRTYKDGLTVTDGTNGRGWIISPEKIYGMKMIYDDNPDWAITVTTDSDDYRNAFGEMRNDVIASYPDYADTPTGMYCGYNYNWNPAVFGLSYGFHKTSMWALFKGEDGQITERFMEDRYFNYVSTDAKDFPAVVGMIKENAEPTSNRKDADGAFAAAALPAGYKVLIDAYFVKDEITYLVGHYLTAEGIETIYVKESDVELTDDKFIRTTYQYTKLFLDTENAPIASAKKPSSERQVTLDVTFALDEEVHYTIGGKEYTYAKVAVLNAGEIEYVYFAIDCPGVKQNVQVAVQDSQYVVSTLTIVIVGEELAQKIELGTLQVGENRLIVSTEVQLSIMLSRGVGVKTTLDGGRLSSAEDATFIRFKMPGNDCTLTVTLAKLTYTVKFEVDPTMGEITGETEQTITYGENTTEVVAVPKAGYRFVRWTNTRVTTPSLTIENITNSKIYTAIFEPISFIVTDDAAATGDVLILTAGEGGTVGANAQKVAYGAEVTITATANAGYKFVSWSDGNTDATRTLTMTEAKTLTATFAKEAEPSVEPSAEPSAEPSTEPSTTPSANPSGTPGEDPSVKPSENPSTAPSVAPSTAPSESGDNGSSCGNSCGTIAPVSGGNSGNASGMIVLGLFAIAAMLFVLRKKHS